MAIDTYLLDRLRMHLERKNVVWTEKRMFGGICFMVDNKMCFGTFSNGLMARVSPDESEKLCEREGVSQMMQANRPMAGYLLVNAHAYDLEQDLEFWIDTCLAFNPLAKASKK